LASKRRKFFPSRCMMRHSGPLVGGVRDWGFGVRVLGEGGTLGVGR
jgi:hypothetical protein